MGRALPRPWDTVAAAPRGGEDVLLEAAGARFAQHAWPLHTKYYSTQIRFWEQRELPSISAVHEDGAIHAAAGEHGVEGIIAVFDVTQDDAFESVREWGTFCDERDALALRLLVASKASHLRKLQMADLFADGDEMERRREVYIHWCLDHGFEYIEANCCRPDLGGDTREKEGVPRVVEALQSTAWASIGAPGRGFSSGGGGGGFGAHATAAVAGGSGGLDEDGGSEEGGGSGEEGEWDDFGEGVPPAGYGALDDGSDTDAGAASPSSDAHLPVDDGGDHGGFVDEAAVAAAAAAAAAAEAEAAGESYTTTVPGIINFTVQREKRDPGCVTLALLALLLQEAHVDTGAAQAQADTATPPAPPQHSGGATAGAGDPLSRALGVMLDADDGGEEQGQGDEGGVEFERLLSAVHSVRRSVQDLPDAQRRDQAAAMALRIMGMMGMGADEEDSSDEDDTHMTASDSRQQ
ncbi:hypothetical protein JKP88DRAFT_348069 [Tribonema minus]|uniref:Uncharacterized protein n=1 Tax=Tribonema minus TaxID=303371 RepID=A0A835Z725_9STRA|nr:hypothetical protein JKP88DRAFT_348069 [Tribonema minus]